MKRIALVLVVLVVAFALVWSFVRREGAPEAAMSPPQAPFEVEPKTAIPAGNPVEAVPEREVVEVASAEAPAAVAVAKEQLEPQLALVFGRVLPPRGEETLAKSPACGLHDATGTRRKIECAEDGAFAISGIPAGSYWLYAGDNAGATGCVEFELVAGVEQHEVNVTLERPWSLEVRVRTSDGEALKWLWGTVVATLEPLGEWYDELRGSPSNPYGVGSFRPLEFRGPAAGSDVWGTLSVDVDTAVWVHLLHGHRVIARQPASPPQATVEFVVDASDPMARPGSLRGRLLDAQTGEPLQKANLRANSQGMALLTTDADGRFEARALAPGLCRITLSGAPLALDQLVRLEPGVETDLGDLRLGRGLSIEGRVSGALGGERQRMVRYEELDEPSGALVWNGGGMGARIEADGAFKIEGLLPRRYQLDLDGGGETARQRHVVDLRNGSVAGLEFVLQRASTLSVVIERAGRRLEKVEIHDEAGTLVMAPKLRPGPPQALKLAPGHYTLRFGGVERQVVLGSEPLLVRLP